MQPCPADLRTLPHQHVFILAHGAVVRSQVQCQEARCQVNEVRVKPRREAQQQQQQPQQEHWGQEQGLLEVACSGNLILPAYSYEPPADRHSALAVAVQVIVQHIASLAQEPSDVSTDTNVHGEQ